MGHLYRFHQLDVFTDTPLRGNPLAVVHDADDLNESQMAAFARWTQLSETTFLLKPQDPSADYRVRIFTPGGELPFAGHPTLGSAQAWVWAGGQPRCSDEVVQECGVGLIRVRRAQGRSSRWAFAAPPLRRTGALDAEWVQRIAQGLGLQVSDIVHHQWVDNGPGWCAVMLRSAQEVLALRPQWELLNDLKLGVVGPHAPGSPAQFEVRAFVPSLGVPEDPVTGSLNAGLAQWLMAEGLAPSAYVASQGAALGRAGRIFLSREGNEIWVGGDVTGCVTGQVNL